MSQISDELIQQIRKDVSAVCRTFDADTRQEMVQDAIVRYLEIARHREIQWPRSFAFGIVLNLRRDRIRAMIKRRRWFVSEPTPLELRGIPDAAPLIEDRLIKASQQHRIPTVIAEMVANDRDILVSVLANQSMEEGCQALGLTEKKYIQRKWRATTRLKKKLAAAA